jgi:hypothetical protein
MKKVSKPHTKHNTHKNAYKNKLNIWFKKKSSTKIKNIS